MKNIIIIILVLFQVSCGGGGSTITNQSTNLTGTWKSNCFELTDSDTGDFIAYVIDTYIFDITTYTLAIISYTDSSCTVPNGNTDNYLGNYTIGDEVVANDGVGVTRLSMTQRAEDWPIDLPSAQIEAVFRIIGIELNFGYSNEGETPELLYTITYINEINA